MNSQDDPRGDDDAPARDRALSRNVLGAPAGATLVGRVWNPAAGGPSVVTLRGIHLVDVTKAFPTVSALCEQPDPAVALRSVVGNCLAKVDDLLVEMAGDIPEGRLHLMAPVDLPVLKAAGETFSESLVERVIEEQTAGDHVRARELRDEIQSLVGGQLHEISPGSVEAANLKTHLRAAGLWSQYLEVGIGPDAEIFTKAPVLAAVGTGSPIGIPEQSSWNNPEPEIALVIRSDARAVGATLANDVNLRDVEGRSALLLRRAKDNNASLSVGPFVRLFDEGFGLDDIRSALVRLHILGQDDEFNFEAFSDMTRISRDPENLVAQLFTDHHYPDGALLLLGTLTVPTVDRDREGGGFSHHRGDIVTISSPALGVLQNAVRYCDECEPWRFGVGALMQNLADRGLLATTTRLHVSSTRDSAS